jgi:insertion element IS1 protein InsB
MMSKKTAQTLALESTGCYYGSTARLGMIGRLAQGDVTIYHTDKWGTYAAVLPQDKLVQSQTGTGCSERNHCRQRHWFGRFRRKSIIVAKSLEMVDLTMALFATFWVNGNQEGLIPLLN